jgi:hypothetical protein
MTIRTDLSALDHKYRAKRTGQSPVEYAASIQRFQRPARQWGPLIATIAILLLAALTLRGV